MTKTLRELSRHLKETIIELQSDAHNKVGINMNRYNNLKLSMDIARSRTPHVIISISMSEATFNLRTGQKESGSLGPDERYALRWLEKGGILDELLQIWQGIEKNRGKATPSENEEG